MLKLENKEGILKTAREKCQFTYKGNHIRITSDVSAQTLKARKTWCNVIQALRENNCESRILHPAKLFFNLNEKIGT
jgi:hypothetical protein